jgi:hypothetical protein
MHPLGSPAARILEAAQSPAFRDLEPFDLVAALYTEFGPSDALTHVLVYDLWAYEGAEAQEEMREAVTFIGSGGDWRIRGRWAASVLGKMLRYEHSRSTDRTDGALHR